MHIHLYLYLYLLERREQPAVKGHRPQMNTASCSLLDIVFVQHGHVKAHSWVRFRKPLRNGDSSEVTGAKLCVRNLALLTGSNRDLHPGKSENNYLVNLLHRGFPDQL